MDGKSTKEELPSELEATVKESDTRTKPVDAHRYMVGTVAVPERSFGDMQYRYSQLHTDSLWPHLRGGVAEEILPKRSTTKAAVGVFIKAAAETPRDARNWLNHALYRIAGDLDAISHVFKLRGVRDETFSVSGQEDYLRATQSQLTRIQLELETYMAEVNDDTCAFETV